MRIAQTPRVMRGESYCAFELPFDSADSREGNWDQNNDRQTHQSESPHERNLGRRELSRCVWLGDRRRVIAAVADKKIFALGHYAEQIPQMEVGIGEDKLKAMRFPAEVAAANARLAKV